MEISFPVSPYCGNSDRDDIRDSNNPINSIAKRADYFFLVDPEILLRSGDNESHRLFVRRNFSPPLCTAPTHVLLARPA